MKGRLFRLVVEDLRYNLRHFVLASFGIVIGTAALAFFLGLGSGVRSVVLGEVFPVDQLEVVPRVVDLDMGPVRMGMGADVLDQKAVDQLAGIPGVDGVYPKMKLTVPALASGGESVFGTDLSAELVADGVEPDLIRADVGSGHRFVGPSTGKSQSCTRHDDCKKQQYCGKQGQQLVCKDYIPVLVSHHVIELYNGTLRRAHDLPKLNEDFLLGLTFEIELGASMVAASQRKEVQNERGMLVGFSDKAIALGVTMPIGYVKRFNTAYGREEAAQQFHAAILDVRSKERVGEVAKRVEELGFTVADRGAERAGLLIAVLMAVFALVSIVIVGVAAVNVMHLFLMLIYQRQREIGIMRAVGASKGDIRRIIFGEAAIVGMVAGVVGVFVALGGAWLADLLAASYVPDFPYKPASFFEFAPWIVVVAISAATLSCIIGALLPAQRAAGMDPAAVLTGR